MNELKLAHIWWSGVGLVVEGTVADIVFAHSTLTGTAIFIDAITMLAAASGFGLRYLEGS